MIPHVTVTEAEKAMDWPVDRWAGQCYGVACQMVEAGLVEGRAVYGYYTGPIAEGTLFDRGVPFTHHGWIEVKEGSRRYIVDPTRWVFEGVAPYVHIFEVCECDDFQDEGDDYVCWCDHVEDEHAKHGFSRPCDFSGAEYDEGGNNWREMNLPPCPEFDESEPTVDIFIFIPGTLQFVTHLIGLKTDGYAIPLTMNAKQAVWLANTSVNVLGNHAEEIYKAIDRAGWRGFIPIDNWMMFFGKSHAQTA